MKNVTGDATSMNKLAVNYAKLLVTAGLLFSLAACNTVEGVGEDVQRGGEAIEDAAQ